jgi:DNA-binding XRE family transcriptional regulator
MVTVADTALSAYTDAALRERMAWCNTQDMRTVPPEARQAMMRYRARLVREIEWRQRLVPISDDLLMVNEEYYDARTRQRLRNQTAARKRHGAHLRAMRLQTGLTQQQLADRIGMNSSYYARLERGERPIQTQTHRAVLSVLKQP